MFTKCHPNTYHARIGGYIGFYGRRATVPARQTQRHARRQNERFAFRVASHRMFPGRAVQTRVRGCFENVCDGKSGYITGNRILYMHVGRALPVGRTELRLVVVPNARRRRTVPLMAWTRRRRPRRGRGEGTSSCDTGHMPCAVFRDRQRVVGLTSNCAACHSVS